MCDPPSRRGTAAVIRACAAVDRYDALTARAGVDDGWGHNKALHHICRGEIASCCTSWVRYQPRAEHPPRPYRAPPGDATLAGGAGAVIPDFGVAEERAR